VKLALLAEVEAELDDATTWYDEQRDGLGDAAAPATRRTQFAVDVWGHTRGRAPTAFYEPRPQCAATASFRYGSGSQR
jgi:hypothetical protein